MYFQFSNKIFFGKTRPHKGFRQDVHVVLRKRKPTENKVFRKNSYLRVETTARQSTAHPPPQESQFETWSPDNFY